jgi:hypothetical protein
MSWSVEFPGNDYPVTLASKHPVTPLWPEYLDSDPNRLFIIERSKNANLVVYYARKSCEDSFDPGSPVHVLWHCWGWTGSPETSELTFIQRNLAYGYSHQVLEHSEGFKISLTALSSKPAVLRMHGSGAEARPIVEVEINGVLCRLIKIYVFSTERFGLLPVVHYMDIYGLSLEDQHAEVEHYVP